MIELHNVKIVFALSIIGGSSYSSPDVRDTHISGASVLLLSCYFFLVGWLVG